MKKSILSFGIFLTMAFAATAQDQPTATPSINPNAAKFKFETETVDYGTIVQGTEGTTESKFKNVGKEPLIITETHGSCGCTVPTAPKDPIKPGETAVIKVKYATDRVGAFEKTVTVTSNADTPSKVLKIKGTVKPDPTPAATTEEAPKK